MAWYGSEWSERGDGSAEGRPQGGRGRWRQARPRGWSDASGGYGEYVGGSLARQRPARRAGGMGYDFDYPSGEWGWRVGAQSFGTRASHAPLRRAWPVEAELGSPGRYRPQRFADDYERYGRDFAREERPGRWGSPTYRSRGGPGYGKLYDELEGPFPGYGPECGYGWGFGPGDREVGWDDFRGARPHYGRTPRDRWPARASGWSRRRMDDEDIREAVRENLFQDSFVDPGRIAVDVDRGVVTLRGEVDDFLEARYAWDDAWESPGVRGVINHLTVRTDRASEEMDTPQSTGAGAGTQRQTGGSRGRRGGSGQ